MSYSEWKDKTGNNDVDIYIASYFTTSPTKACYWKNNKLIDDLQDSENAQTNLIFIDGNDIYIGGKSNGKPCYWKNKRIYYLEGDASDSPGTQSIMVRSGVIYTAGFINNQIGSSNACYWVNTKKYNIFDPSKASTSLANSIYVDEYFNIYIAGRDEDNGQGFYWNSINQTISYLENNSYAYSICVKNDKVYIAGRSSSNYACYWIDKPPAIVSTQTGQCVSIFVSDNDIYSASNGIYYFKNLIAPALPGASQTFSLTKYENDLYIVGRSSSSLPCYWKNSGEAIVLSSSVGEATGIAVKHRIK